MKKIVIAIVVLIIGVVSLLSFGEESSGNLRDARNYEIQKKWDLPEELNEISGIAWIGDNRIACVQDEDGIIFIYNLATSRVENSITFGKGGDYEGMAVIGEDAYILRSDGVIYEVSGFEREKIEVQKHETVLTDLKKINIEGLCADPENNRLLLAVKERAGLDEKKEIFAFDLGEKETEKDPFFLIDLSDPLFEDVHGKLKTKFNPGAIAIHPQTGEIYILDGTNPKIVIADKNGEPKELVMLEPKDFGNPEGLTFSEEGVVYISNEAENAPANILRISISK